MQFNSNFKNIELHSHLDGSFQAETLFKIAQRRKIDIPFKDSKELRAFLEIKEGSDLRNFLKIFDTVLPIVLGDEDAIREICDDYIKICAEANICYVETRFAPKSLADDCFDVDKVVRTVLDGLKQSCKKYGVVARVILSAIRNDKQQHPNVLELARKYKSYGVVGIDLAGDERSSFENNGTSEEIIQIFKQAKKEGIHRTVHAGENGSVKMIEEAINEMYAERIGHGYQVLENEEIYENLRKKDIHFEICPSSSFLTGAVSLEKLNHPIHRFIKDKLNYSINCDDIMITGRNLKDEYVFCKDELKIPYDEIRRCNLNAAKSCFLNSDEKKALMEHLIK